MHKSRVIIVLAVLVALLPVLGFPNSWEAFFQVFAGVAIVLISVWTNIDKKLSLKHKAQQRAARKVVMDGTEQVSSEAPKIPEATPSFGKRVTDFYPKTGQPGRRATDIRPNVSYPDFNSASDQGEEQE